MRGDPAGYETGDENHLHGFRPAPAGRRSPPRAALGLALLAAAGSALGAGPLRPLGPRAGASTADPRRADSPPPRLRPLTELLGSRADAAPGLASPKTLFDPSIRRPPFRTASILNTDLCPPALRRGYPVLTGGLRMQMDLLKAIRVVEDAHRALREASDIRMIDLTNPGGANRVCVGIYDDGGRPNALAIGRETILFGKSLFERLRGSDQADAQLTIALTHELAHLLQNRHGRDYRVGQDGRVLEFASTRRKELVADCLAGTLYSMSRLALVPLAELKLQDEFFRYLGDKHRFGSHGQHCHRKRAFAFGFTRRSIPDPRAPAAETSGAILSACEAEVDRPGFLYADCR